MTFICELSLQKLKSWFESIVTSLVEKHDMPPAKKLTSAVCVLQCINLPTVNVLYMSHSAEKFLLPLAGMLSLHPSANVKAEYKHLCSKIPVDKRYYCTCIKVNINTYMIFIGLVLLKPFLSYAYEFLEGL